MKNINLNQPKFKPNKKLVHQVLLLSIMKKTKYRTTAIDVWATYINKFAKIDKREMSILYILL